MPLSDEKIAELFKVLDRLGELGEEELLVHFTSEKIEALRLVSGVLKEGMDLERMLSEKRFVYIVKELFETKRVWSVRLDETLTNAGQELDQGNRVQALWILNGFIRFCTSPYYREIAEEVLKKYENEQ
jgi:hypothetical protein